MSESFKLIISNLDPWTVVMLSVLVATILILLPKAVNDMGIKKLGPIQLEQENQTLNYLTNKQIEEIDIQNRENLWDATEEFIAQCAMESKIGCVAAVNAILQTIMSPIKTMVLLDRIAGKLIKENEEDLTKKLSRAVTKSFREFRHMALPTDCPARNEVAAISPTKYEQFFPEWIQLARDITVKACFQKIHVYEQALEHTKDKHWKSVFQDCISKNIAYIEGMGWIINKQNKLERA